MGSENDTIATDLRKKHRRSNSGDAEEEKRKRRKHHRHHRSKKRDEEEEKKVDLKAGDFPAIPNEDMEEGEIVEEDPHLFTSGVDAAYSLDTSDSPQGQMKKAGGIGQTSFEGSINGNDAVSVSENSQEKEPILSPSQIRSPVDLSFDRRSGSYFPLERAGSQPTSDIENVDTLKIAQLQSKDTVHTSSRKYANESYEEISFRHDDSEHFSAGRSKARDKERESNVNCNRYADRQDAKYAKDISHREWEDGDVDRGHKYERESDSRREHKEKERKKSRNRENDRDRSRGTNKDKDRQMEWDVNNKVVNYRESQMTTEKERKHGRELEKVTENDTIARKTPKRDRHRDAEDVDRYRERKKDHYKEREYERQRERSVEIVRHRDWGGHRETSLERDRDRKKEGNESDRKNKDWSTERNREKERVRERSDDQSREQKIEGSYRERDNGRDRSRDRYWDAGHHKYDVVSSKLDRHSGYHHDNNSHSHDQDRTKTEDIARIRSTNSARGSDDTHKREEEEHEEYQEKISMQLAEEEEDDVNRIKEESRRRRQAILEKYKNMKLQDQPLQSTEIDKGDVQENLFIDQSEPLNSFSEVAYDKSGASLDVAKSPIENGESTADHTGTRRLGEGTPKSERCDDMFCDDIFGDDTPTRVIKTEKGDGMPVERSDLHDNWDDAEGYYSYRFGELLDGRYEITAAHGKGVFSSVVRAKDLKAEHSEPEEVAIKIIRNNETMFKAGQSELIILKKLAGADPEDRRHCVRFLSSFKYRNHLCLVFESLHMNLREVLKKFGRNIGLKLTAVRAYAKQLLIALKHLRNCGVLHCDIKPDNMLVNESKNVLKLCDFGNAMFAGKNEITPYLVSRFYRAPEIILGLSYDHPVDIWSIGCCLYELYTGKVLFPGATNNDMLRLHLELKGPFPKKMLRKGAFTEQHFDQDLNFLSLDDDPVTKKTIKRVMVNIKPKDIGSIITGSAGEDPKMLNNFKDLLDKIFILDPDKRMTVSQALAHPFITGK